VQPYSITSIGVTGTYARYFAQTNDCPGTLDVGSSCTIRVTFTPTVAGSKTAKVTIASSAPRRPQRFAVGTGYCHERSGTGPTRRLDLGRQLGD